MMTPEARSWKRKAGPRIGHIIFILFFLGWSQSAWSLDYKTIEPGLAYATQSVGADQKVILHLLKIDLNNFSVEPIDVRTLKTQALSVEKMAQKTGALAVINANFFDKQKKPLGLILSRGKVLNPFHPTLWWATLLIQDGKARIVKLNKVSQIRGYQSGVQAGPRLVIWGKVPRLKDKTSPKSAVGIDGKGNLILIASEGSLSIQEFAKILARPPAKGGVGLTNALNLDGGSSTQFYLNVGGMEKSLPSLVKVPVGLGVFRKPGNDH